MKHPVLALMLALLLALGAGVAVYWYTAGAESRALASQSPVQVLVSSGSIATGTSLAQAQSAGLLTTADVAEDLRPAGALTGVDAANETQVALEDLPAGRMVMTADFGTAVPQLAAVSVPDGMLAVTVQFEDPAKVGSFLRPGTHVAVFDTYTLPNSGTASGTSPAMTAEPVRATRALLPDVEVLAVGDIPESGEQGAAADAWAAPLVTVSVDQGQAEQLIHAARTGQLYLALLGSGTSVEPRAGVSDATLFTTATAHDQTGSTS